MRVPQRLLVWTVAAATLLPTSPLSAQLTDRQRAGLVLQLLPPGARPHATVILRDAAGERTYRTGDGPFLCVNDGSSTGRLSLVCHHRVLEKRLRLERSLQRETGLEGAAFVTRLCQEVESRHMQVPDGATEITAAVGVGPDGALDPSMTVYRLIWLPFATAASSGVPADDPGEGRPWLHQAGSCGAHIMWSEQRSTVPESTPRDGGGRRHGERGT